MDRNVDNFKPVFKYFKSKQPPPDLSRALHVDSHTLAVKIRPPDAPSQRCGPFCSLGLRPPHHWGVYALPQHPGLLVVRGAFTPAGELFWAGKCLFEYPDDPNMNNIENINSTLNNSSLASETPNSKGKWWRRVAERGGVGSAACSELRWSTLGYHHDWDSKIYSENRRSPFPPCVHRLSSVVAGTLAKFLRQHEANNATDLSESTLIDKRNMNYSLHCNEVKCRDSSVWGGEKNSNDECENFGEVSSNYVENIFENGQNINHKGTKELFTDVSIQKKEAKSIKRDPVDSIARDSTVRQTDPSMLGRKSLKSLETNVENAIMNNSATSVSSNEASKSCSIARNVPSSNENISCEKMGSNSSLHLLHQLTSEQLENFKAEAAIVNYYHPGTSLGPHTDHSEPLYTAPLLSFSLGQPCVFLIGGPTKATPPTPLVLQSGDVIVMGGASRLSYHAVPCVVSASRWRDMGGSTDTRVEHPLSCGEPCLRCGEILSLPDAEWDFVRKYLDAYRINMNVRQVGSLHGEKDH